jgi:hypothetical protein
MVARGWIQSQSSRSVQLYVELNTNTAADGMPLTEPKLLGFLSTSQNKLVGAYIYTPEPQKLELGQITSLWQAKQAIEKATKSS